MRFGALKLFVKPLASVPDIKKPQRRNVYNLHSNPTGSFEIRIPLATFGAANAFAILSGTLALFMLTVCRQSHCPASTVLLLVNIQIL